jgi:hypothetical protein
MYTNSVDWIKRIDTTRQAVVNAKGVVTTPISAIEPDIVFTNNTLGLFAVSESANPSWYKAGNLFQAFLVPFGTAGYAQGDALPLILNRYQIHRFNQFPSIQTQYVVSFQAQPYLKDIKLQVWEYVGVNQGATLDSLAALAQQEIAQINKVNTSVHKLLNKKQ